MKIKLLLSLSVFLLLNSSGYSDDSISVVTRAEELIKQGQYATANEMLKNAVQELGIQPLLICTMVENALNNHFGQRDFISFYLMDSLPPGVNDKKEERNSQKVSFLRYPDQLLQKVINQYPDYAHAYKLLGDFYKMKLRNQPGGDRPVLSPDELQDLILANYTKAVQLQYNDVEVNRWLGDYYYNHSQMKIALDYYQKNVDSNFDDAMTYYHLAKIYFLEKQYSQSYNFAMKAISEIPLSDLNIRRDAMMLAANSLLTFGEEDRFVEYVRRCIALLPDDQTCYIALLKYYDEKERPDEMEQLISQMMLNNPYDREGYHFVESFVVKYNRFHFGEKLIEEIMLKYENSDQVMGNIYWFRGNLLFYEGMGEEAKRLWEISRNYFSRYLPPDDSIFKQIGHVNNQSSSK